MNIAKLGRFAVALGATASATGPTVTTPDGPVVGFSHEGVDAFRGIPYAAPPLGDNRLRPPQPVKTWTTPLDATQWAPSCLQRGSSGTNTFQPTSKAWNTINVTLSSEDCLYLNVYTPSSNDLGPDADPLPVMVYWHAGEFRFGSSNDAENAWPYFSHGRVILVTANVRLGLLGFGALPELRSRDPTGSTGNYGMQDQRAVLHWVQRNIHAFNGDPTRVTIFGESSGGSSVGFHLSSEASAGLFSRAILESPGLTQSKSWNASYTNTVMAAAALTAANSEKCTWDSKAEPETGFLTLPGLVVSGLKSQGTSESQDEARKACLENDECFAIQSKQGILGSTTYTYYSLSGSLKAAPVRFSNETAQQGAAAGSRVSVDIRLPASSSSVSCLLNADAGDLIAINTSPPYGDTFLADASGPTEDGVELKQPLIHQATQHPNKNVPVLGGANLDEGTEFIQATPPLSCQATASDLANWCSLMFPEELAQQVPAAYANLQQPTPLCFGRDSGANHDEWLRAMRAAGESAILCPMRALLNTSHEEGQENVYWYQFVATPLTSANMGNLAYMGSFHGAEVPFVFGDQFEIASDGERTLSKAMGCYWTNFAETGDPNNGDCGKTLGLPNWPVLGPDGNAMVFGNTSIAPVEKLKQARCDLFDKYR